MPAQTGLPRGLLRCTAGVAAAAILVFGPPSQAFASRAIGLSTPSFDFSVAPGGEGKGQLYVINDGTEPIRVMVYAASQVTDASGTISYTVPRGTEDFLTNPASWIRIQVPQGTKAIGNIPYLELTPKQRELVKFDFTTPSQARSGDHQIVLFFEMFEFPEAGQAGTSVQGRLGARIHLRVQGTIDQRFEVRPFEVPTLVIGDKAGYTFVLRNEGNMDTEARAKLQVFDTSENERYASDVVTETTVYAASALPGSGTLSLADASLGVFTVRLTTTYQKEGAEPGQKTPTEIVKDRTVVVVPLWLAVIAGVLLLVLVLWAMWRAGERSAARRADRQARARQAGDRAAGGPAVAYDDELPADDEER